MRNPSIHCFRGLLLASTLALLGCGSETVEYGPTGTVAGTLTMDGEPLAAGTQVVFMHPEKGYAAFGSTDAQGRYVVASFNEGNLPVGTYGVMIQPPAGDINPDTATDEQLLDDPELAEQVPDAQFPFKYRQVPTSGLKFEVKEGENTIPIDISSEDSDEASTAAGENS